MDPTTGNPLIDGDDIDAGPQFSESTRARLNTSFSIEIESRNIRSRLAPKRRRDELSSELPDLIYGCPDRKGPVPQPTPFTECKIYYGTYASFDIAQRRYYLWWRNRYLAGEVLPTTDTYLFIAAYEASVFLDNVKDVLAWWESLWRNYPHAASFRGYCGGWIDDARALTASPICDEISRSLLLTQERFDAAVRTGAAPDFDDIVGITNAWENIPPGLAERVRRTMKVLREEAAEDPILTAAQSVAPDISKERPFLMYHTLDLLTPMLPPNAAIATWYRLPVVRQAVISLLRKARSFWEAPKRIQAATQLNPVDERLRFGEVLGVEKRVAIKRSSVVKRTSDAETIDGLKRTLSLMDDPHVFILMGLVLHLTDIKPYVEGQIVFSRELRLMFESSCKALGFEAGLGPYRQSFYYLGNSRRSPWELEPFSELLGMKMNTTCARFVRGLQRELLGSDPRGELYRWLCDQLSSKRSCPAAGVYAAFEAATGVPPFVGSLS